MRSMKSEATPCFWKCQDSGQGLAQRSFIGNSYGKLNPLAKEYRAVLHCLR